MRAFDLGTSHVHLGPGGKATVLPDFGWDPESLADYEEQYGDDGPDGRIVMTSPMAASWTSWERHPAGDEVVVLVSGRADLLQEVDGEVRRIPMLPGQAIVNPTGVWHTADVHEPGLGLFITPGMGTEHKPR